MASRAERRSKGASRRRPSEQSAAAGLPTASTQPHDRRFWLLLPVLLIVTAAAYNPAWFGAPLWDDAAHLTPPALASSEGLWRIWTDLHARQQYYPLTNSAFWLLHQLWGNQTLGYHLVNIGLHASSAFLLSVVLRQLGVPGASVAAVVFALHPVHVESVAWMSELKNTLSGVFYLLAAAAFLTFNATRRRHYYACAVVLFAFALMSKTVTATLPASLMVVLWWKRGELTWPAVRPLVPMLVLGIAAGLGTAWVERTYVGAEGAEFQLSLMERVLVAGRALLFYVSKLAWPSSLTFIYPRWDLNAADPSQYLYPLAAVIVLATCWWMRRWSRAPLAAALIFGGTLFPALGFVDVYPFRFSFVADHFQYLASIAPIALASAAAVQALARRNFSSAAAQQVLMVVVGIPLAVLTWNQSRQYVDPETLYSETLRRNPACWMCHNNLAVMRMDAGRSSEALSHIEAGLRINPGIAEAHDNHGVLLRTLGRKDEGLRAHLEAVRLAPSFAKGQYNLGRAFHDDGQLEQAIAHYVEAIRLNPGDAIAHDHLGSALTAVGRFDEALQHYTAASRLDPTNWSARNNEATTLAALGRFDEAIFAYRSALVLRPGDARTRDNLGFALFRSGRHGEALEQVTEALRADPDYAPARVTMAGILLETSREAEAIPYLQQALTNPGMVDVPLVHADLGAAYLRTGQRELAVRHLREALRLRPDLPAARQNLAIAVRQP